MRKKASKGGARDLRSSDWRYQSVVAEGRGGRNGNGAGVPPCRNSPSRGFETPQHQQKAQRKKTPQSPEGSTSMGPLKMLLKAMVPSEPFLERFRDFRCEKCHGQAPDYDGNKQYYVYFFQSPSKGLSMLIIFYLWFVLPRSLTIESRLWRRKPSRGSGRGFVNILSGKEDFTFHLLCTQSNFMLRIVFLTMQHSYSKKSNDIPLS